MTKISPTGRQALGAKANAQKATGSAGKFGHLQNDAPPKGLTTHVPSLYEAYGIDPSTAHRYSEYLAGVHSVQQASQALRRVYPDASVLVLEKPDTQDGQWSIHELRDAAGAQIVAGGQIDDIDIPGSPDTANEVFWNLPADYPPMPKGSHVGLMVESNGKIHTHVFLETAAQTPKLDGHMVAGLPAVPQREPAYNPYAAFDTREEIDQAHGRMTDSIEKSGGIIGDQAEFDAYHRDRRADLDAARATQMEALEEKLAENTARVVEARRRSGYFETVANDTQARLALHDVQVHFPAATTIHLENEDQHNLSDAPLNAVRVLDAEGNILFDSNGYEVEEEADELMTALSEHSGEMDWEGLRHITGQGEDTFYSVPLAVAYEPQPAYLADTSQVDAPQVPYAKRQFLSECNTIEHLEFKMSSMGARSREATAQEAYETRLAELRAAGL